MSSARSRHIAQPLSPRERLIVGAWAALACGLLALALTPTSLQAQLAASALMLVLLWMCFMVRHRATSLRSRAWLRLAVIGICTFVSLRYMHWRATESLPLQFGLTSMVCGLLLFAAEGWGFVNMVLGFVVNSEPFYRRSLPLPADKRHWPHVDVYIPTYNEDPAIVRPTIVAATQLDYPADKLHVYVLDDGGTDQKLNDPDRHKAQAAHRRADTLRALAEHFGATYLSRARNESAKAGNINSALASTSGDLLLVLDCDHIPAADFLQRTVGFFLADPKLFVLQTPHNFVSPDPIERNLNTHQRSPAENELFYDVMQPGLDFWGTSFFCGSAAVLRRSVIDELGGISGKTITEDAETTLDALSLGYHSAYYNRPMVSGLQPETFSGFIVQRVRWGQGMLQIFLLKNPWEQPGLTFMQRVLYTNFAIYWGFGAARLIMLLAPPAYLILGINLCDTTAGQLLAYAGPALLASLVSTQYFYGRVRWPFMSQLYEVVQSIFVLRGLWQVIRQPTSPSFKVTPKGEVLTRDFVSSLATPFYILLLLTLAGALMGIQRFSAEPLNRGAIAFVEFWAVLDALLLLGALGITLERRQLRAEPRAVHREEAVLMWQGQPWRARTLDASASGMGLHVAPAPPLRAGQDVTIELPQRQGRLPASVQSIRPLDDGGAILGLRYRFDDLMAERLAVHIAFGSSSKLVDNNRERHSGRTVFQASLNLVHYALRHGLDHLEHLALDAWRQRRWLR